MRKGHNRNLYITTDYRYVEQQRELNDIATKYGLVAFRPDYHAADRDCNTVLIYTIDDFAHNHRVDQESYAQWTTYTASEAKRTPFHIDDKYIYRDYIFSFENTDRNGLFDMGYANRGKVNLLHYKWKEELEKFFCESIAKSENPTISAEHKDKALEYLWDELTDVPVNEDEELETRFYIFPAGTEKEEIWHWFDKRHSKGVYYLLYEREV